MPTTEVYCAHCQRIVKRTWVASGMCKCGQILDEDSVVYVEVPT